MTANQKQAIKLSKKIVSTRTKATKLAIELGLYLILVKKELPAGKFQEWLKSNMLVGPTQCQTYMRLAKSKAHVLADKNITLLNTNSELMLLKVPQKLEDKIRKLNSKSSLTTLEVKKLIDQDKPQQIISDVHEITNILLNLEYKVNEELKKNKFSTEEWKDIKSRLKSIKASI